MIEFKDFRFGYPGHNCICDIDVIPCDGLITVLGNNGVGKTTFFESILGLKPHSGEIIVDYHKEIKGREFRYFSYIPQDVRCDLHIPTRDWILHGLAQYHTFFYIPSENDMKELGRIIRWYHILPEELLDRDVSLLSGGEIRKAAIARALLQDTDYIIMDEIFSQLDPVAGKELRDIVRRLGDRGKTIFVSTHDVSLTQYSESSIYIYQDPNSGGDWRMKHIHNGALENHIERIYGTPIKQQLGNVCMNMEDGYTLYTKK